MEQVPKMLYQTIIGRSQTSEENAVEPSQLISYCFLFTLGFVDVYVVFISEGLKLL